MSQPVVIEVHGTPAPQGSKIRNRLRRSVRVEPERRAVA